MLGSQEQDQFVSESTRAVVTTLRGDGSPSSSVIYYYRDGDDLIFSTTDDRLKARTLHDDPRVAVCVVDESPKHRYVTVEGKATIERDNIVEGHILLNRAMRRDETWQPPEDFAERLTSQHRVLVRVRPERVHGMVNR